MELVDFFNKYPKIALAFSGGRDSSLLLKLAVDSGADVGVYLCKSELQPDFIIAPALEYCKELNVDPIIVDMKLDDDIRANTRNRCYLCKNKMIDLLKSKALEDGFEYIMDGTTASDDESDRPGMKALKEKGVLSPLKMCGIDSEKVDELISKNNLDRYKIRSYSCLATRIQNGIFISNTALNVVETVEKTLIEYGLPNVRSDYYGPYITLKPSEDSKSMLAERYADIEKDLSENPITKTLRLVK